MQGRSPANAAWLKDALRKLATGPGLVIAAIAAGSVVVFGLFYLIAVSGLVQSDVSAHQGETVDVDGGNLTALKWCAFFECPKGGYGVVRVWVKACATEDGWGIDQADFHSESVRGHSGAQVLTAQPEALGHRTLDAGECVNGITAFRLNESPAALTYFGHGYSVLWELRGIARIPLTESVLRPIRTAERAWLTEFERFFLRATAILRRDPTRWLEDTGLSAGPIWSYYPESVTPRALHRLASLGEDCSRALSGPGEPGRFMPARRIAARACARFRAATIQFRRASTLSPGGVPAAGTAREGDFEFALNQGVDHAWYGLHALVRAHDLALVILIASR